MHWPLLQQAFVSLWMRPRPRVASHCFLHSCLRSVSQTGRLSMLLSSWPNPVPRETWAHGLALGCLVVPREAEPQVLRLSARVGEAWAGWRPRPQDCCCRRGGLCGLPVGKPGTWRKPPRPPPPHSPFTCSRLGHDSRCWASGIDPLLRFTRPPPHLCFPPLLFARSTPWRSVQLIR